MKKRKTSLTLIAMVIALGLAAIGALGGSDPVTAHPAPHLFTTGMFGVARGQTARTNVVNLGGSDVLIECLYFDGMGNVVARSERRELTPGQATFFDVDATANTYGGRVELRAVVKPVGNPNIRQLNFTAEAFDNDTFRPPCPFPATLLKSHLWRAVVHESPTGDVVRTTALPGGMLA